MGKGRLEAFSMGSSWISGACYASVAVMWLVPDRRIEKLFSNREE